MRGMNAEGALLPSGRCGFRMGMRVGVFHAVPRTGLVLGRVTAGGDSRAPGGFARSTCDAANTLLFENN